MFCNKCHLAKDDAPNVIDDGKVAQNLPPEVNISGLTASRIDLILQKTDTHYILQMTNISFKSLLKPFFVSSFVRAHSASWTAENCTHNESRLVS
jgi:hypothetical protein